MSTTPTAKAKRKERAARFLSDLAPYMGKVVAKAELLNAGNNHYRLTGPLGGQIDYFPSTTRWYVFRTPEITGTGLAEAMALLETLRDGEQAALTGEAPKGDGAPACVIFADGSYDLHKKVGGWGVLVSRTGGQTVEKGGAFSAGVGGSAEAEARAIANGVRLALHRRLLLPGETVMIQSDCQAVLSAMMKLDPGFTYSKAPGSTVEVGNAKRLSTRLRKSEGIASVISAMHANRLKIILRHVKGHQAGATTGAAWANKRTDKLAGEGLKEARRRQQREGVNA